MNRLCLLGLVCNFSISIPVAVADTPTVATVKDNKGDKDKTKHEHHRLHHALYETREACAELRAASHDYGGHRSKALADAELAIKQIEICLNAVNEKFNDPKPPKETYKNYKHHPHLHHAIQELEHAHKYLKNAPHNFNGHREKAQTEIHAAIQQLHAALKFAQKQHDQKKSMHKKS